MDSMNKEIAQFIMMSRKQDLYGAGHKVEAKKEQQSENWNGAGIDSAWPKRFFI